MAHPLTAEQQQGVKPDQSVWMCANAGTGKTRVLVDRVLCLLLQGESPASILGLTFTRAAAAEMQERIQQKLVSWAGADDATLDTSLHHLGLEPTNTLRQKARALLLESLNGQDTFQISTLDAFCQKLISRFPVEAGLYGKITLLDDRQTAQLIEEARQEMYSLAETGENAALNGVFERLAVRLGDGAIQEAMKQLKDKLHELFALWSMPDGQSRYDAGLKQLLEVTDAPEAAKSWIAFAGVQVGPFLERLSTSNSKKLQAFAASLSQLLPEDGSQQVMFDAYQSLLLNASGLPDGNMLKAKNFLAENPDIERLIRQEQMRLSEQLQYRQRWMVYEISRDIATLGQQWLATYQQLKERRNLCDYQDILLYAIGLLQREGFCAWVISKLDQQLRHILLDEAQDTSPLQWQLLRILTEELFQPDFMQENPRTLFVVGDDKQSIYRFQGADVASFYRHRDYYQHWFEQIDQPLIIAPLTTSFRSATPILKFVDALTNLPAMHQALVPQMHHSARPEACGRVECWPLEPKPEEPELLPPWELESPQYASDTNIDRCAQRIAEEIRAWLDSGRMIGERSTPVTPGDILILVQTRNKLVPALNEALRAHSIPVAGLDRLKLHEHPAVKDVQMLMQWSLLQSDDLALASILKGPLFGWDDQTLFDLAYPRGDHTLWEMLLQSSYHSVCEQLTTLAANARQLSSADWLCYLFEQMGLQKKMREWFGGEADDICTELRKQAFECASMQGEHLQHFLHWLEQMENSLKRVMEQSQDAVRIMTVHASKGLEAPIVILPDTTRKITLKERILWREYEEYPLALVKPQGKEKPALLDTLNARQKEAETAENYRLFYVAATRARDELIICGFAQAKEVNPECWYALAETALLQLEAQRLPDGRLLLQQGTAHQAEHPQNASHALQTTNLPDWLYQPFATLTEEKTSSIRNAPQSSAPSEAERRGLAVHTLLELLPASLDHIEPEMLLSCLADAGWSESDKEALVEEVLSVHRSHPWIFAENALAESNLRGEINWHGQSYQLRRRADRLLLRDGSATIIDFKTDRNPPAEIPVIYRRQLAQYAALIRLQRDIQEVKAAIVWTCQAELVWLSEAALSLDLYQPDSAILDSQPA